MISVFVEMVAEMLESAQAQLANLKRAQEKPHVLDNEIIERLLTSYGEQNRLIPIYLEQCQRWQEESLNVKQTEWVADIKNNLTFLQLINQEILRIAEFCSDKTINKVLGKSDIEAGLELFK
jgi:hypothetical protein